jgi:hypothetical protein
MFLFFRQLEIFSSLNIIGVIAYREISVTIILAVVFALAIAIICCLAQADKLKYLMLVVLVICWLPMVLNEYYNHVYDLVDNLSIMKLSVNEKKLTRLCTVDANQDLQGMFCYMPMFIDQVFATIEPGAAVKLLTIDGADVFLNYPLVDRYHLVKTIDQADYLLLYLSPSRYILDNDILYQINQTGDQQELGRYSMYKIINERMLILKKLQAN